MSDEAVVIDKIRRMLLDKGLHASLLPDGFQVPYESTAVNVRVVSQEDRTLIHLYAPLAREVPATPELFEWIATKGQEFVFGSTHYESVEDMDGGVVYFEHNLLGDYLDSEELITALGALAGTGEVLDDIIVEKFGGKRFSDE